MIRATRGSNQTPNLAQLQNYLDECMRFWKMLEEDERNDDRIIKIIEQTMKNATTDKGNVYQEWIHAIKLEDFKKPTKFEDFLRVGTLIAQSSRQEMSNKSKITSYFSTNTSSNNHKRHDNKLRINAATINEELNNMHINQEYDDEGRDDKKIAELAEENDYLERYEIIALYQVLLNDSLNIAGEEPVLERKDDWNMVKLHRVLIEDLSIKAMLTKELQDRIDNRIVKELLLVFGGNIEQSEFANVLSIQLPQEVTKEMFLQNKGGNVDKPCICCGRNKHTNKTCVVCVATDGNKVSLLSLVAQPELMRRSWFNTCCRYGIFKLLTVDQQDKLYELINQARSMISLEYLDSV
jgi:hypothetical protein